MSHLSPWQSNYRTRTSSSTRATTRASNEPLPLILKLENWISAQIGVAWRANGHVLCIFRLWKRGLPRKLFLMFVKRVFHNWPPAGPPACWLELFVPPRCGDAGCTIADCVIWSLSANRLDTIIGPELARWCTGDAVHDDVDRLLLLLLAWADDELEWSVICVFGRPELLYEEWRDGDEVADAGDEGRKIAATGSGVGGRKMVSDTKLESYKLLTLT